MANPICSTPKLQSRYNANMLSVGALSGASIDFETSFASSLFMDQDRFLSECGYTKMNKISDTLQGSLYKAQRASDDQYVAIKIVEKTLYREKIAIQDGTNFIVAENIVKEAFILKYLSVDNSSIGHHIIKYIDFFQDNYFYYLVVEYIDSEIHLKQFIDAAFVHMKNGKLARKHYNTVIKFLLWQIMVTIHWMHTDMQICHLDICMENIMVKNCSFIEHKDGTLTVNPAISIKLCDFGVAETFNTKSFISDTIRLSIDNELYLAPQIYDEEPYDARSADMWSIGIILFQCLTAKQVWTPIDIIESQQGPNFFNAYWMLKNGLFSKYLQANEEFEHLNNDVMDLLINLLEIEQKKRFCSSVVLRHKWFSRYYKKYYKQIAAKAKSYPAY